MRYDLVVIGGGVGGLTAATYAAKRGLSVLVCEQNAQAGGMLAPYQQDGFRFDLRMPTLINMGIVLPVLAELEVDSCALQSSTTWKIITPRGPLDVPSLRSAMEQLADQYPDQSGSIQSLGREMECLTNTLWKHFNPNPLLLKGVRARGRWLVDAVASIAQLTHLWRAARWTVSEGLRRYPLSADLRSLLIQLGYEPMSYLLLAGLWQTFATDYFLPPQGISQLTLVLRQRLSSAGGEVATRAKVVDLLIHGGRAAGVRLADGRVITARSVVAACDLVSLYRMLAAHQPFARLYTRALATPVTQSYLSLFLGLKERACELPFTSTHTFWLPDSEAMAATELPVCGSRGLIISSPSLQGCSFAPPGASTLVISTPASMHWLQGMDEEGVRARLIDALTHQLMERWPQIRHQVSTQRLLTPMDYQRLTGTHLGASAGWSMDPHLSIPTGLIPWRTPLPGLYLAGQWVARPGGVAGAMLTGRMAAMSVGSGR